MCHLYLENVADVVHMRVTELCEYGSTQSAQKQAKRERHRFLGNTLFSHPLHVYY